MNIIIMIILVGICFNQGYNAYNCEHQNKVFNKSNLPLKDVKEYNHFCGKLMYGFGLTIAVTMFLMVSGNSWVSLVGCVLVIIESVVMIKYYRKKEITFLNGH